MHFLTWDTGIVAALVLLLLYSLVIQKHKALSVLLSMYVAYVVASTWGDQVVDFFLGSRTLPGGVWVKANLAPYEVRVGLFVLATIVLASFVKIGARRAKYGTLEVVAYSVLTIALGALFILFFMDPTSRALAVSHSRLLPLVIMFKQWILGLPVVAMVLFGIYGSEE